MTPIYIWAGIVVGSIAAGAILYFIVDGFAEAIIPSTGNAITEGDPVLEYLYE